MITDHEIALKLNWEYDHYRWHFDWLIQQSKPRLILLLFRPAN